MRFKYNKEYELALFFRPEDDESIQLIKRDLDYVNKSENRNFAYGLFDPTLTDAEYKEKIKNFILCIAYLDGIPVAFNYFVYLRNDFFHAGLIVINKNNGSNLMRTMILLCQNIIYKKFGSTFFSTITSVPKAYEIFLESTNNCYPSPHISLQRPPAHYKKLINILHNDYIIANFPKTAEIKVNEKKFILTSIKREAGFKESFHDLPRANKVINNLFCQCWINYDNDEDIIAIGKIKLMNAISWLLYEKILMIKGELTKI